MNKIAIFGDSYTVKIPDREGKSWPEHLIDLGNCITNFGISGSGVYYSYNQFIKNYEEFDTILFLVSAYSRKWIKTQVENSHYQHIPVPASCQYFLKEKNNDGSYVITNTIDRTKLQVVYDYMIYALVDEEYLTYQKLMVEQILRLRPDTILIPCFRTDISYVPNWNGYTLVDISFLDRIIKGYTFQDLIDMRHCHLNDHNNLILAHKINDYLKSNRQEQFRLNINEFKSTTIDPSKHFLIRK
jgi:hypothetical protein